jgi:S-formylglutathione hydrolase FrmB
VDGPVRWTIAVLGVAGAVLVGLGGGRRWWTWQLPAGLVISGVVAAVLDVLVVLVWRPIPDGIPLSVRAWAAVGVAGVVVAIVACLVRTWRGRATAALGAVLVLVFAAEQVNVYYGQYPTLGALFDHTTAVELDPTDLPAWQTHPVTAPAGVALSTVWRRPADLPDHGAIVPVDIPGTKSGFAARPAWVYLPPAYLSSPRPLLPVLVLVAGQPGSPGDWLAGGQLTDRMDTFAAAHDGLAPIVVIPDDLGNLLANPLCVDSRLGNAASYLTVDVPAWVRQHLQVDENPRSWAFGGFSHGGTCALQMSTTAPDVYPTFVDISGQDEPTLGTRERTVREAFGGDAAAFRRINPLDILSTGAPPGIAGFMVAGADDGEFLRQAKRVYAALQRAGVPARLDVLPGGHSWRVWGPGLTDSLPWLAIRLGLTSE